MKTTSHKDTVLPKIWWLFINIQCFLKKDCILMKSRPHFTILLFIILFHCLSKAVNLYHSILRSTVYSIKVVFFPLYSREHWIFMRSRLNFPYHFGEHWIFWKVVNVYHFIMGSTVYLTFYNVWLRWRKSYNSFYNPNIPWIKSSPPFTKF